MQQQYISISTTAWEVEKQTVVVGSYAMSWLQDMI